MFGLGFIEILIIAALALIFIGPQQLPEVARVIARLLNEWKRATSEFTASFHDMNADIRNRIDDTNKFAPPPTPPAPPSDPAVPASGEQNKENT